MLFLLLTLKNARKLGNLAKLFLVVANQENLGKMNKRKSSTIQKFSKENVEMFEWSAKRDESCQVVRESEKDENR